MTANLFEYHLKNIPFTVEKESDVDRYLRAFAAMAETISERHPAQGHSDDLLDAMRGTIRFIADDAFRYGFETCHEKVVAPLQESTVPREAAIAAVTAHGLKVQRTISEHFEEEDGVPNSLTVAIDEIALPTPTVRCLQ